jgi:hypothetical protein
MPKRKWGKYIKMVILRKSVLRMESMDGTDSGS